MGGKTDLGPLREGGGKGGEEGRDGGGAEGEAASEGKEGAERRHCGRSRWSKLDYGPLLLRSKIEDTSTASKESQFLEQGPAEENRPLSYCVSGMLCPRSSSLQFEMIEMLGRPDGTVTLCSSHWRFV